MKFLLDVAFLSGLVAICCADNLGFCSFCTDTVNELMRSMDFKSAAEMGNSFCDQVTLKIDRLDSDCRSFVDAKLEEIKKGIILGQNTTDICRQVQMC